MRSWSLSDLALSRPVTVGMALCAVLLLGVIGMLKMPLSFLPLNQEPRVFVRVNIDRTSPEVLERDVIRPIEERIAGMRDLQRIQVGSGSWGVRINLDLDPGTDVDARKIELRDRIERVRGELPDFVRDITIGSYTNFDDPVMEVQISSGTDLSEDYYLIEERVVRRIERIRGVARVELEGVSPHELEVEVDLESANRTGVSLDELGTAVRDARQGRSLGLVRGRRATSGVRSPVGTANPETLSAIPLRRAADATLEDSEGPVFAELGEVARVTAQPEERRRGKRLNGRRAINLEVFSSAGTSAVDISRSVRAEIVAMGDDPALDGIELLVVEDQGETILDALASLRNAGLYGGLLGIAVLFLFLHRVRTTLSAAVSIPLSVLAACGVLFLRGDQLNVIVIMGIVLGIGMLIDNAVVIVSAIAARQRQGDPPLLAAQRGARDVGFATIASTLSTVIVFIPLVLVDSADRMTVYLRPLGITFAIGLVASLIISQTAVPLLMGRVIPWPKKVRPTRHRLLDAVTAGYGWLIDRTLRFPRITVLVGLAAAASAIYPAMQLNIKLGDAEEQAENLPIRLEMAGSRSYEKIEKYIEKLEAALLENQEELEVRSISCSFSDHWGNCRLYPSHPFDSERQVEEFKAEVQKALPIQIGVEYRLGERQYDWRENRDRNVVEFALKGEDMGELMQLSELVAEHLRDTLPPGDPQQPDAGGVDKITTPFSEGARELHVELDRDRLQRLGLSADEVAGRVALSFQGVPLGKTRGPRGELSLRLSAGMGEVEDGIEQLNDLRLTTEDGREVPLASIATIELARRPWWIQRVDRQTEVKLKVRFFSTDVRGNWESVSRVMADYAFPPGYNWGRGTRWKHQREASNSMLINLGLCLLLVYAVMASLFESFLQPFGILITCLLGCIGAPWALYATGTSLDTTAIVGMFILIGVVVNNGIMLVDKVSQLRQSGMARHAALREAGQARLRPILMTMTTTVLGLLPMLIHHPTMAGVYYHAIAIVVAGGLVTSTLITLVFLPAAYTMLEGLAQTVLQTWQRVLR